MTVVATAFGADRAADAVGLTDGFSAGLVGAAAIAGVGAVLAALWLRSPKTTHAETTVESERRRRGLTTRHRRPSVGDHRRRQPAPPPIREEPAP